MIMFGPSMSGGAGIERPYRAYFSTRLAAAFALIASAPNVGHPYRRSPVGGTRRVLLARSRYHVYYAPLDDALVVLAVWHASRGSGPPLRLK
jgi:plasmid stabilization system protein ParE